MSISSTTSGTRDSERALDDLDRLAFRLERTITNRFPELRSTGFRLMDLEESLLPFRDARREMANGELAAWELAILRLVSGERGYVKADARLARHATLAINSASPRLSLVKEWSSATLLLGGKRAPKAADSGASSSDKVSKPNVSSNAKCCRHCNGRLPADRGSFCPHCGLDLNVRQCPACSAKLEIGWRYCTTCGRGIEIAELPSAEKPDQAALALNQ